MKNISDGPTAASLRAQPTGHALAEYHGQDFQLLG